MGKAPAGRFARPAAGLAVPAWGAEVVSSNIVGYDKINLSEGFNLVGIQFQTVGATSDLSRKIATIATLDDSMSGYDDGYEYATQMQVWDPGTASYTIYGWAGTSPGDIDGMDELNNQWLDFNTEETDETIQVMNGVWIKAEKAGTMTLSGQVLQADTPQTINLAEGFNIVANPYPVEVKIAEFGKLDATMSGYDDGYEYATQMQVWNPATASYTIYGWAGTSPGEIDGMSALNNQWLDFNTEETTDTLPIGAAVWIKAEKAGTITFDPL